MKKILFRNALVLICVIALSANLLHAGDVVGKVVTGYQGWFTCANDNSPINLNDRDHDEWIHWGQSTDKPVRGKVGFELYPDMREYTKTYATGLANLGNGDDSRLFSSYDQQVVNTHFRWMNEYGIDCAALQRFGHSIGSSSKMKHKDGIARMVKNAAEQYNQKFYIMYDITDWDAFRTEIKSDWNNTIVGDLKLTSSSAYAKEGGKPVVCIWGIGSNGRPGSESSWKEVIKFFKDKGCFVIAGVVKDWRGSSSARNAAVTAHMVHPWHVGVYSASSVNGYYDGRIKDDMQYCKDRGVKYMPTMWAGFAWSNWKDGYENRPNHHPRKHGDFMWTQFYKAKQKFKEKGMTASAYVAMFDEYDEATAIAKAAENKSMIPTNQYFLTLDADGVKCSSDFYLRLTGDGARMIKGQIGLTSKHPTSHTGGGSTYNLLVTEGGYDGIYKAGATVNLNANTPPVGKIFDKWVKTSGNPSIADIYAAKTTLIMPANNAEVTATFKNDVGCSLPYTASNKSISKGSLNWTSGPVDITCAETVKLSMDIEGSTAATMEANDFIEVTYKVDGQENVLAFETDGFAKKNVSATISGSSVEIFIEATNTASDELHTVSNIIIEKEDDIIIIPTYFLLVNSGGFDGEYKAGEIVNIRADAAPVGKVFDKWVSISGNASIADISAPVTTLTMPANAAEVTASFKNDINDPVCDLPYSASNQSVSKGSINWSSGAIDISCVASAKVSMDIEGSTAATMESNDYIEVLLIVDGNEQVLAFETDGSAKKNVSAIVSGNSVEISIESLNSASDETHTVSNISITEDGGNNCSDDLPYASSNKTYTKTTQVWTSAPIDISCASSAKISMDIEGSTVATMESSDYLNVYYKVDGGTQKAISTNTDGFSKKTIFANVSGSSVQIIVEAKNSASDETYSVSNISVVSLGAKSAIGSEPAELALEKENFILHNNYPNPFSTETTINYELVVDSDVSIDVYNIYGQKVSTLLSNQRQSAGIQSITWNPSETGNLANGIYIYVINGHNDNGSFTNSQKMNYIK